MGTQLVENGSFESIERKPLRGADVFVKALLSAGVDTIFGYPGGAIMPVYDALCKCQNRLKHILVRHEQGAAHAAEGYARVSGKPGVCLVTSGPGATNLVTGLADAMMDSVPLVCVSGQVTSSMLGSDAFQETDVIAVTTPVTKWSYQITDASEIEQVMLDAFSIAVSGRPGPVMIDITKDAQLEACKWNGKLKPRFVPKLVRRLPAEQDLQDAAALINAAERPLILAGHGVLISKASGVLQEFIEKSGIPVACTLHGLSAVPTDHPLYAGMLGMHGNYAPNVLTNQADLLIAVGMRFDDRVTGKLEAYAPNARVIHIEVDPAEIGKNVPVTSALVGDARAVLEKLLPLIKPKQYPEWLKRFKTLREQEVKEVIEAATNPGSGEITMSEAVNVISEASRGEAVVVADVGQHQMITARYYRFKHPHSFITSGGLGTMGFALPAAFGATVAGANRPVIAIIGDGGFQMTLQELGTIAQEGTALKMVVLNNSYLGMVRQWQELFFEKRYSEVEIKSPDLVKLADAFGIAGRKICRRENLKEAVNEMLESEGPYLLEIQVKKEDNVFPMIPAGSAVDQVRLK
ncbi:MAG: biosynthetic-type acetolactate synthase large subunit [Candidatus Dadabacteria bacterium]|nr:MAG: biosynthetic-type acetolactate synthase large subunit [Candidatus Dadabacteria bacterium]